MAGAPIGNQNAVKAKRWQQAIDRALERRCKSDGIAELDRLAEIYLDTIEEMTASTEKRGPSIAGFADLADRLDGKPAQAITGADGGLLVVKFESADGSA
jgi:hypothetical protein